MELNTDESEKARRMDLLQYQIAEIQEAELEPGEDEELENQRRLLQNSVTVVQALSGSLAVLDGSDDMPGLMDQSIPLNLANQQLLESENWQVTKRY